MSNRGISKKLIFNKYRIQNLIYSSNLATVYKGVNEKESTPVAIKIEKKYNNCKMKFLESEAYYLFYLKGFGIPKIISFGRFGFNYVLIEELLGESLGQIFGGIKPNNINIKDICMIALQSIDRLEFIHSKFVIHRDIKPDNFVIGRNDPEVIYLIDFGLSHKYKSSRTGKHIRFNNIKLTYGSLRYLSINGNKGYEQSRRDDLESLGYMLIYLATGSLPWLEAEDLQLNVVKKYIFIYKIKNSLTSKKLCKGLPEEIAKYLDYCRGLLFEEDPDYNYLRSLFEAILTRIGQKNDLRFRWISKKIVNQCVKRDNSEKNIRKRKGVSPHIRLLNKIEFSLKKKRTENNSKVLEKGFTGRSSVSVDSLKFNNNLEIKEYILGNERKKSSSNNILGNQKIPEKDLLKSKEEKEISQIKNIKKIEPKKSKNEKYIKRINSINYIPKSKEIIQKLNYIKNEVANEYNAKRYKEISSEQTPKNPKLLLNNYSKNRININNPQLLEDYKKLEKSNLKRIQIIDDKENKVYEFNYNDNINIEDNQKIKEAYEKSAGINELYMLYKNIIDRNDKVNGLLKINNNFKKSKNNSVSKNNIENEKNKINKSKQNYPKKIMKNIIIDQNNITYDNKIIKINNTENTNPNIKENKIYNKDNKSNRNKIQYKNIKFISNNNFWDEDLHNKFITYNNVNLNLFGISNNYNNKNIINNNYSSKNENKHISLYESNKNYELTNILKYKSNLNNIMGNNKSINRNIRDNSKKKTFNNSLFDYNTNSLLNNYKSFSKQNTEQNKLRKKINNNRIISSNFNNYSYSNQLTERKNKKFFCRNFNYDYINNKNNSSYSSTPNILNFIKINNLNNINLLNKPGLSHIKINPHKNNILNSNINPEIPSMNNTRYRKLLINRKIYDINDSEKRINLTQLGKDRIKEI